MKLIVSILILSFLISGCASYIDSEEHKTYKRELEYKCRYDKSNLEDSYRACNTLQEIIKLEYLYKWGEPL